MVAAGEMATVGTGVVPGTEALTTIVAMDPDLIPMIRTVQVMNPIPVVRMVQAMGPDPTLLARMTLVMDADLIPMIGMVDPIAVMVGDGTTNPEVGR
jgi:hypothetical protein